MTEELGSSELSTGGKSLLRITLPLFEIETKMVCLAFLKCKTVRIGRRTRRGHFTSAGITDVRSIFGGKNAV